MLRIRRFEEKAIRYVMIGIHKRTGIDVPERHFARLSTLCRAIEYLEQQATAVPRNAQ